MSQLRQAVRGFGTSLLSPLPRSAEPELLDAADPDPAELAENFRDIQRVNQLLGGRSIILRHLPPLLAAIPARQPVTLLDLATGVADIPLAVLRWAERRDLAVTIVASDCSIPVLNLARERVAGHPAISLARHDARAVPLPDKRFDVVLCSLALHHFTPDDAGRVLREMDRLASVGFILNDLRRDRLGYAAAWIASRLTTRNRLTRHDAPLSVRRAYTPDELAGLLRRAGIGNVTITTHPWFRMAAVKIGGDCHA
ncbi:MAG: methyltransferase domain-containing protein [Chloroflexota bacterium]|nr:methyltransferase domain-containing protein [Chloroflexota bacterium]